MRLHRVKSRKFVPADFDFKELRWFRRETLHPYDLLVSDVQRDGTFVLWASDVRVDLNPAPGKVGQIKMPKESLDQAIVDKIEKAGPDPWLRGCDFVIFEDSPKSAALHHAA